MLQRRSWAVLLCFVLLLATLPVTAQGGAERKIEQYLKRNDANIRLGTAQYYVFLKDILWGVYPDLQDADVLTFAANQIGKGTKQVQEVTTSSEHPEDVAPSFRGYDRTRAVQYAYAWAKHGGRSRNPAYPDFGENDCTNFVSQVVHAGTVSMTGAGFCGSTDTSDQWYVNPASWWCFRSFAWSSSWVNVYDFWRYQTAIARNAKSREYLASQLDELREAARVGDIIQLQTLGAGVKWHSMVVTMKENGEIYLTYHSGSGGKDVVDRPLEELFGNNRAYWHIGF